MGELFNQLQIDKLVKLRLSVQWQYHFQRYLLSY